MEEKNVDVDSIISVFKSDIHLFARFMNAVSDTFKLEPSLNEYGNPIIYTIKSRLKDPEHLRDKISRKWNQDDPLTKENIYSKITDLCGVRVLHLYQDQFIHIHELIMKQVNGGDWYLNESPIAYSWDPETTNYLTSLGLDARIKDSYYTSIHYIVKPKSDSSICCEIQVRTLFEEIWGEIDHTINYPTPSENNSCKEQLRVLSKLVSTGTRLADSIFRAHNS